MSDGDQWTGAADGVWYFAYGSNMSPGTFVERRGMRPLTTRVGWLDGYRLCFDLPIGPGERGCASVLAMPGARVAGVAYRIGHADAERLDRTELGYRRIAVEVAVDGRERMAAFTYQSTVSQPGRRPSRRYLDLLLDGARVHGLPADYVAWLDGFDLAFDERGADGATLAERTVRFYFAYDDPEACGASARLAEEIVPLGVAVDYKPVRGSRAGHACLGFYVARAEGRGRAYHDLVHAGVRDGGDVDRAETLAAIAERAGLDPACFLDALTDPQWAAALETSERDARADGVGTLPTFVFQGRVFSGSDRIAALGQAIRSALG
jgi:2-hydroxychromene-2-carboxylate isomerase